MDQVPLVQISDLHIGSIFIHNSFGFIAGHHEHDLTLCRGLSIAYADVRKRFALQDTQSLRTVVSGDLSANGLNPEFAMAHSFLRSRLRLHRTGYGDRAGLAIADNDIAAIPGNHDHWDGMYTKLPFNRSIFDGQFRHCPWKRSWQSTDGGLLFEVFGVDSNSGLTSRGKSYLAQGSISSSAFQILEGLLVASQSASSGPVVRAITVHHSLSYVHGTLPRVVAPKVLDQASKDRLLELAAKYNVAAILTGHTHDAYFEEFPVSDGTKTKPVWELRSPTTLQGPAKKTGAGFLVHKLALQDAGPPLWSVWHYHWDSTQGTFRLMRSTPDRQFSTP